MGEGEACVAVLSNLGENESEKVKQKRDHQWLTRDSDLEPFTKKQAKEVMNDVEVEPFDRIHVEVAQDYTEQELSDKQQGMDGLNDIQLAASVYQPVKCFNASEIDPCGRQQAEEVYMDIEAEASLQQPVEQRPTEMELESCGVALRDTEVDPSVKQPPEGCLKEVVNDSGLEPFMEHSVKECLNDVEHQPCPRTLSTGMIAHIDVDSSVEPVKDIVTEVANPCFEQRVKDGEMELEPCLKKEVKDASNDDLCSEVSNPDVSLHDNASSFQTVSSQPVGELVAKEVACGEITSTLSGDSSGDGSSSDEEHGTNDASYAVSTSHVVLEIPKHVSTSGIRKITFKFSKRKEDYDNQLSASAALSMSNSSGCGSRNVNLLRLTDTSRELHEAGDPLIYSTNMEAVTSGKVVPDSYPTTVKRLLSTRILEGAKVKYISASGELIGIVSDSGYLCGCAACNFSKILRAHEFEEHAGGKTRHPNNHIYLENGKPIYSIIQEMKTAPLSIVDEVIKDVAGSSVNEEYLQDWKASLQRNADGGEAPNSYHMKLMNLYHSTSYTSQPIEDSPSPYLYCHQSFSPEPQKYSKETKKDRKRLVKKPRLHIPSIAVEPKRNSEGGHKKRDNDLHRLLFMPNGLPDGTDLAYYARGMKILEGYKQGSGIVCSHCDTEISPSQFEAHAGWAAKRQPYRHIYISNGLTLHDIALLLSNGQSIATSNSDDMCAVCGDRGELIFCDGCPRAFHAVCLGLEGVPAEDWNCPYCRDNLGGCRKAAAESRPIVIRLTRVVKAREYEAGGCVICRAPDFSTAVFDDRTVMLCDQCEKEYHVGCLREREICDLKALPSEKWFCCSHCEVIHGAMQEVVSKGAAVVSAFVLNIINKKHIEKGLMDVASYQVRWRVLSGKSRYPEHLPLLSRAAAIFRECFDPIVATSGRDLIPVMVYGRNISGQEFGGIYCVVLMVGSIVVSAGLLRIFGQEVAELPLVATSRQNQGKGYFQALFSCIEELLLSLGVVNLVLPAAEEAESIWTKKLGFRKMSDERYSQYSRDIQLTIFKGTSMLEKELH